MKKYEYPTGLKKLWSKAFYGKYANWPKTIWFYTFNSKKAYNKIKKRTKNANKEPLRVIFFVLKISMWKYDSLFKLLLEDNRFEPIIIPYPIIWESKEELKQSEKGIIEYCKKNNFPYKIGYDIDTQKYIPADELNPDFVSYSQPYNNCPDFWKVEKFYKKALIFNYPYGLPIDNNKHFNNLLSQNVCWRLFYHTKDSFEAFKINPITHGSNFLWVGNVFYDKIFSHVAKEEEWKIKDSSMKRIIWAPHHTIGPNDDLPFSNFIELHEDMLKIAQKYENKVQFVFKPHPGLYYRLINLWGKEKTDNYYREWKVRPNTNLINGAYTDLFMTSDALIHDSGGFTIEYLYTNKPVMFVNFRNNEMLDYMPGLPTECYNQHYIGKSYDDIINFIESVVLDGNDKMKESRADFVKSKLIPPNNQSVGQNMFDEFLTLFS